MFESVREYSKELIDETVYTKQFLNKLYGARRRILNSISKGETELNEIIKRLSKVNIKDPNVASTIKTFAKAILFNELIRATQKNKEFSREPYFTAISDAVDDDKTFRIKEIGTGKNKKISVVIDLNATAGRLNEWGAAIKKYRSDLGVKVPRKNSKLYEKKALQASKAWARIYNQRLEKFQETIEGRLFYVPETKKAPFWQIIDKGTTAAAGMKSERGGYPTPKNTPTNFVSKAEKDINDSMPDVLRQLTDDLQASKAELESEINRLNDALSELNIKIDEVKFDVGISKKLSKELGIPKDIIDGNKLHRAIEKAKNSRNGKVNIGIRNNPVYVYYKQLRKYV